ncbi:MAG: lipoyl(octanoyl) transferase LipB [Verrucomicrobia bacterium]|nr:lipoyl(octanoyl) transferase LipB [Verrucomicrobiota bacterium]MDA1086429.1 lipoyl(octanoyl) transferase LipB [Verrucomicrobiota bacterium]
MDAATAWIIEQPVPYAEGVALQERLVADRIAGTAPDTVLFLEHRPVITLGSRGRRDYLLLTEPQLQARGIELHASSRGGDVTYHGPGQLVMYPIVKLGDREADAHGYLCNLEEIAIRTLCTFGIKAYRREGMTGAWTDQGKVTSIGVRLRRWVTYHGLSLNVDVDLTGFDAIVPCGLEGEKVTSLKGLLGDGYPDLATVRDVMMKQFSEICGRPFETVLRR